jgi:paraquat-inducible protein B
VFQRQAALPGAIKAAAGAGTIAPNPLAPSRTRLQRYSASLDVELRTPTAVAAASRRAVAIAAALSGYQQSVVVRTASKTGYADIVLRIPAANVREAIRRLSALGTITAEDVAIQDVQVQVNAADQRIAGLQTQLAALESQFQTTDIQRRIASLTAQIGRLQRARASTVRAAHYATVDLRLTTPQAPVPVHNRPGPLHGLGIAFHWAWIGAVYALALGAPLAALLVAAWLLTRAVRRRREDRLLAR